MFPDATEKNDDPSSLAAWEETWHKLATEVSDLEQECLEEATRIAELPEFSDNTSEDPLDSPIGLFGWMDECLWGGLAELRTQVRTMRPPLVSEVALLRTAQERIAADLKHELGAFQAQQQNLAAALDVTQIELQGMLEPFPQRCGAWVLEPSIQNSPSQSRTPPWRGVRGGDGGAHSGQREPAPGFLCKSEGQTHNHDVESDAVIAELRETLCKLEEDLRQAGGPTGYWGQVEHEIFLRVFRLFRRRSPEVLLDSLCERVRERSREETAEHVRWFLDCEQRQSAKREILAKRQDRIATLEQEAKDAKEQHAMEEWRRKEGLRRCRSAEQRRQVGEWRLMRNEMKEFASILDNRMQSKSAQLERKRNRKLQKDREKQQKQVLQYVQQRAVAREAEKKAASADCAHIPVTSQVRKRIADRHRNTLTKLQETQTLQRSQSQPSIPKNPLYQHVEANPYATTAAFRQRLAARQPRQQELELATGLDSGAPTIEPEPEAASGACLQSQIQMQTSLDFSRESAGVRGMLVEALDGGMLERSLSSAEAPSAASRDALKRCLNNGLLDRAVSLSRVDIRKALQRALHNGALERAFDALSLT